MLPFLIVISAVAPLPLPVRVTRLTPENVCPPSAGVYPRPTLLIERLPTAEPAVPTRSPVAFVDAWKNVFPNSYASATVVPRPTLIDLDSRIIGLDVSFAICAFPLLSSGL